MSARPRGGDTASAVPRGGRQAAGGRRWGHSSRWSGTRSDSGFSLSFQLFSFSPVPFPLAARSALSWCCEDNGAARWGGRGTEMKGEK